MGKFPKPRTDPFTTRPLYDPFTYDLDGNLTSDGLWTNLWNGENRRITIESRSTLATAAKGKVEWTILADGRWVERVVSTNNGTSYYPSQTNRYVWDNQVLLAVLDHTNGVVLSFMRGLDLSGSLQGAGGVGGVLAVKAGTSAQCGAMTNTAHFTCYDGNGNVTALMNAATGEESARYEYAPFAEKLRETGPMAKLNPIRFSTQYADDVTDDTKYLFRDLSDGRWFSRDSLEEFGHIFIQQNRWPETEKLLVVLRMPNISSGRKMGRTRGFGGEIRTTMSAVKNPQLAHFEYQSCQNDLVNRFDLYGQVEVPPTVKCFYILQGVVGLGVAAADWIIFNRVCLDLADHPGEEAYGPSPGAAALTIVHAAAISVHCGAGGGRVYMHVWFDGECNCKRNYVVICNECPSGGA